MGWYNTWVDSKQRLYCEPPKLTLTVDQIFDIVERYIEKHSDAGSQPIGLVILIALKDAFPCDN